MRTALKGAGVQQFGDSSELDGKALDIAFKAAVAMSKSGKNPKASGTRYGDSAEDSVNSIAYVQKKLNDFWGAK